MKITITKKENNQGTRNDAPIVINVTNNDVVSNNELKIMNTQNKQLLRQIKRIQNNTPLMPAKKMDKYSMSIYAELMSEWLYRKQSAQLSEQMLEEAIQLDKEWKLHRNNYRQSRDMIAGGCLLLDKFLKYEQSTGETYYINAALVVWDYIQNIILDCTDEDDNHCFISDILHTKQGLPAGSAMTVYASDMLDILYSYWQALDAAIDSLNSEIKMLKNVIKYQND